MSKKKRTMVARTFSADEELCLGRRLTAEMCDPYLCKCVVIFFECSISHLRIVCKNRSSNRRDIEYSMGTARASLRGHQAWLADRGTPSKASSDLLHSDSYICDQ